MNNLYIIIDGHFSEIGNFIGTTTDNAKIHIYKIQMDLVNLESIHDVTFPLFVFGAIKVFDELTGEPGDIDRIPIINDNGVRQTFERLTAMAVYTSFDSLIKIVYASKIRINKACIEQLRGVANDAGVPLEDDYINSNLNEIKETQIQAENVFKEYFNYLISII